jgi:hypothetical protein
VDILQLARDCPGVAAVSGRGRPFGHGNGHAPEEPGMALRE